MTASVPLKTISATPPSPRRRLALAVLAAAAVLTPLAVMTAIGGQV